MPSPKISVVIPAYNYDRFIARAIDSVLEQTYSNYEIIVINDGSSDRTEEILQFYGSKICYLSQANQGLAASRNRGLELAQGELVVFLDADDWLLPQMLENAVAVFTAQPELGIVVSGWQNVNATGEVIAEVQPWLALPELNLENWVVWRPLLPSATVFRKAWLTRVGGFDGTIFPAEDIDCVLKMVAEGCQSAWCPQIGACYRLHDGNVTGSTVTQAKAFEQLCDRLFARSDLAWEIRQLENKTRFYCLLWSAWRLYITGCDRQMLDYLAKSLPYSLYYPGETLTKWGEYLTQNCADFRNTSFDVYRWSNLPGWQELVASALEQVKPTISVIIIADRGAEYLLQAIESVLAQTTNYEIIVLDNSTDNISQELECDRTPLRYISQPNQGIAAAKNRGLHLARGEFIVFLDANDLLLPNSLKSQLEILQADSDTGIAIGGWQIGNQMGDIISTVNIWAKMPEINLTNLINLACQINPSATMYRRQWLEKVRGFKLDLVAETTDCFLRLIAAGCSVNFCREIIVECRQLKLNSHAVDREEAIQLAYQRFFGLSELPPEIPPLENPIRFQALVYSAWRFYHSDNTAKMLTYLRQSLEFVSIFGSKAIARWLEFSTHRCTELNQQLNAYSLSQIPGWQQLVEHTLATKIPRVSVIIPVYNNAQYIGEAIASVLRQTYTDYEIIVINDGSTDDINRAIATYFNQIRYVRQENQGVSAARNRGLYLARGELIAFLDADDIFLPDKLAQQVAVFDSQPNVGIVNSGFEVIQADGKAIAQVKWWQDLPKLTTAAWVLYKPIVPSAMMFRKQWLTQVGGFDRRFFAGEDIYLTLSIIAQGCPAAWLTEITVQYRRHQQSVTLANPLKQLRNTELMLETFFNRQDLPSTMQNLATESKFSTYVWMASRCYQSGFYAEMAEYLQKSQQYSSHDSWVKLSEQWVRTFQNSIEGFGENFDPYVLGNLPEWKQLIENQLNKSALLI